MEEEVEEEDKEDLKRSGNLSGRGSEEENRGRAGRVGDKKMRGRRRRRRISGVGEESRLSL